MAGRRLGRRRREEGLKRRHCPGVEPREGRILPGISYIPLVVEVVDLTAEPYSSF